MKRKIKVLLLTGLLVVSNFLVGCVNIESDPPLTLYQENVLLIQQEMGVDETLAKSLTDILLVAGFEEVQSIAVDEIDLQYYFIKVDEIVLDIEMNNSSINKIKLNCNNDNNTELSEIIIYDSTIPENIEVVTEETFNLYKLSQEEVALQVTRSYVGELIDIEQFTRTSPNSAGGVDINIEFVNKGNDTIKYIRMGFYAKNAVGDFVYCSIRGSRIRVMELVGPIEFDQSDGGTMLNYWYNYNISAIGFNHFEIEYMNGEIISFNTDMLNALTYNYNNR